MPILTYTVISYEEGWGRGHYTVKAKNRDYTVNVFSESRTILVSQNIPLALYE